jgi:hypothetical protein
MTPRILDTSKSYAKHGHKFYIKNGPVTYRKTLLIETTICFNYEIPI